MRRSIFRNTAPTSAFTLVELLVVVSIIGLLVGLLAAGIPRAMDAGMKAKAKGEATAIVAAVKAYKQEYGRFPGDVTQSNMTFSSNSTTTVQNLIKVLNGDSTTSLDGTQAANPKGVRFLEGSKGGTSGLPDPWGNQYIVVVDTGETGAITYTYAGTSRTLNISVLALSYGSDGTADSKSGKKNDVFSTDLQ
ncbi:MAG: prepilin-type N-terminal cleavage/methylation domain-containing protein [Verrucomicrobia bacterium]|nr:prepilin-type N-terminal cleavage/methylation domain-containing protein [Verrucomicrobiota bacterium]